MSPHLSLSALSSLIALALAGLCNRAEAADAEASIKSLDTLHVQGRLLGRSTDGDVRHYAGSRQVIGREQLRYGPVQSLDGALQRVPGIKIFDETGTGALPQLMLRGLYESRSGRVQVLEDDVPLSLAPYGQTSLSLFPIGLQQVDRIDVVRGGAAVRYGPNNVGGLINLISPEIPTHWTTTLTQKVTAAGAGQFLSDFTLSTAGFLNERFGISLDANRTRGQTWRSHSDTAIDNIRLRAEWWLSDTQVIKASVQRYLANLNLPGALSPDDYRRNPRQATRLLDSFNGHTTRASLRYQHLLGDHGPFQDVRLNWNTFSARNSRSFVFGLRQAPSELWRADLPPEKRENAPRTYRVLGSEPQLTWSMGETGGVRQDYTVGVRVVREDIQYREGSLKLPRGQYTVTRDWRFEDRALAAYVSNAISLADGRVTLTPGLRFERLQSRYFNRATGAQTRNEVRSLLPGLTVGVQANSDWFIYADGQRSLRAPQVTQIIFGNHLDPELAWNYELGARYQPNENIRAQVGIYRIDFDQQIQFDSTTRLFRNLGRTQHQGAELELHWHPESLPGLVVDAGYAYLDARQKAGPFSGNRVPYTSRHQLTLGLTYQYARTVFGLSGYYFSSAFSDAANSVAENAIASVGRLPSYSVWDAKVTHTLFERAARKLDVSLAVNNLFDRRYWFRGIDTSPWGRQPAPGRSVTAALALTF